MKNNLIKVFKIEANEQTMQTTSLIELTNAIRYHSRFIGREIVITSTQMFRRTFDNLPVFDKWRD